MTRYIFLICALLFASTAFSQNKNYDTKEVADTIIDPKIAQKELLKLLKEAKELSLLNQKPNFEQARKKIKAAKRNPQFEANKAVVLMEAGNVEYNCFETERNKPASGANTNLSTLYLASERGFNYFDEAYNIFNTPDLSGKIHKNNNTMLQKKAWNLFNGTDGFRMNAANAYENKDWKSAHKCFDLFVRSLDSKLLNDYASKYTKINDVFSLYKADSIVAHAKYFRALCAMRMDSTSLAIKNLDEIKENHYEQNTVLQELAKLYEKTEDKEKYVETLRLGIKYLPSQAWFARNLVNLLLTEKDYDEAIVVVDQLMEVDSDNPANIALKGQLIELQGDTLGALECYAISYTLDSLNYSINSNIARIYYNNATKIESEYFDQRLYEEAFINSIPIYLKAQEFYLKAYELDKSREDPTIARSLRAILYKQFSRADCKNPKELVNLYNEISKAYGMDCFPQKVI